MIITDPSSPTPHHPIQPTHPRSPYYILPHPTYSNQPTPPTPPPHLTPTPPTQSIPHTPPYFRPTPPYPLLPTHHTLPRPTPTQRKSWLFLPNSVLTVSVVTVTVLHTVQSSGNTSCSLSTSSSSSSSSSGSSSSSSVLCMCNIYNIHLFQAELPILVGIYESTKHMPQDASLFMLEAGVGLAGNQQSPSRNTAWPVPSTALSQGRQTYPSEPVNKSIF